MTSTAKLRRATMSVLSVVAIGCGAANVAESNAYDEPSLIVFQSDTSDIVAPATVVRGVPFTVTFRTFGGGCVRAAASTRVVTSGPTSTISPYDQNNGNAGCTRDLALLPHSAIIQFDTPGIATLRLIGQQRDSESGSRPAEITRNIVVQ